MLCQHSMPEGSRMNMEQEPINITCQADKRL